MDAIKVLRQRAAAKRDKALKDARHEFQKTCRLLDMLEAAVGPEPPPAKRRKRLWRPIIDVLAEVIPKDRTFTVDEAVELLRQAQPEREFNADSVRTLFPEMAKAGLVRKVRRAAAGHVHWAAAGSEVVDEPIAAMNIADATELALSEAGPLTATEIVVGLKERGYRPDADPRTLLSTFRYAMKRNRGRFQRDDSGRWNLAE